MKVNKLIVSVGAVLFISACGEKQLPPSAKVKNAPTDASQTGYLITADPHIDGWSSSNIKERDLVSLLRTYPNMKVRVINPKHGVFEIYGVPPQVLEDKFANRARIRKNIYVPLAKTNRSIKTVEDLRSMFHSTSVDRDAARAFLDTCLMDSPFVSPQLIVNSSTGYDQFEFSRLVELGQSVKYDTAGSVPRDGSNQLDIVWIVYPTAYSRQSTLIAMGPTLELRPDTVGTYQIITVAKDSKNVCTMAYEPLYVTSNPKYNPLRAVTPEKAAELNMDMFWQLDAVNAREGWLYSTGRNVTVAIIDSGVNYNHPYLAANIAVNEKEIPGNGIDDDENGFTDDVIGYDFAGSDEFPFDDYGHGSHCAGIAASPVMGIAPDAKILPVKIGSGVGIDVGSIIGGILYAVDNHAKVLNLSFNAGLSDPDLKKALEYARAKGVVVVAAAGNGDARALGLNNDKYPTYPASFDLDNIITVAASNAMNNRSAYSNYGLNSVHVAAPGGDSTAPIRSTYKENARGREFELMSGTSMAAPVVVGIVAQMLSIRPDLSPTQVREILMATGVESSSFVGKIKSGKIVNSLNALLSLLEENESAP